MNPPLLQRILQLFRGLHRPVQEASPAEVFSRFQSVLRANNRALELIADLGEKLGGDYLFDRRYIEITVDSLVTTVGESIANLDTLRGKRHQALHDAYQRLTEELRLVLSRREDRNGPRFLDLGAILPRDLALVGGKAAHLASMRHDPSLTVPDGMVITSRAFHDLIDHNLLRPELDTFEALMADREADAAELDRSRQRLERAMTRAEPPPGFLPELAASLRLLCPDDHSFLAVRSSAQEEDMDFSFAGQFRSLINIPAAPETVFAASREVMASLFAPGAVSYRRRIFPDDGQMSIAVVCQRMIPSQASGVAFSVDTMNLRQDTMVIVAAWGQGEAVVEGRIPTDTFIVKKGPEPFILERHVAKKTHGLYPRPTSTGTGAMGGGLGQGSQPAQATAATGGLEVQDIAPERQAIPCLTDETILTLARQVCHLETTSKWPQDVEWAIDNEGALFLLQARSLILNEGSAYDRALPERLAAYSLLSSGQGRVAQQGIGAGPVRIINHPDELADFPEGAVLVSRRDSSRFVEVMAKASAIVTEVGTPVSHMATICREFKVPCLVNVQGVLGKVTDGEVITIDTEDRRIYQGRVEELLAYNASSSMNVMASLEFRLLRRILKKVSVLSLVDPMLREFTVEGCLSYHDILRFNHETAVQTLVEMGKDEQRILSGHLARRLALPIPTGILVIDIGGGLTPEAPANDLPLTAVASIPFASILKGMLHPGIWHTAPMTVGVRDLMHSMFNPAHDVVNRQYTGHNIAVIGSHYVNLCFRLGYHFNIIDVHCGPVEQNNHIYFRFLGGVTDMTKRSRRSLMISTILTAFDFTVQTRGDLVTARLTHLPVEEMERILDILGRLVGFTRQLDVKMESDERAEEYAEAFLNGDYEIASL